MIPQLEAGDEKAKKDLLEALEVVLLPALKDKSTAAQSIAAKCNEFSTAFQPLHDKFQDDFKKANKVMIKDKNDISNKQNDIWKWTAKARHYEFEAVAAGVALPCTAVTTVIFSETGVGLIIGGILMIGEIAAISTFLHEYADAMHHVSDLRSAISDLNDQVAELTAIENQITGLEDYSQKVTDTSANIADGWRSLNDHMENTIKHLKDVSPDQGAITINSELSSANKEWGEVLSQAEILQPNGGVLDEKTFKSSTDMLKAIDDQAKAAKGA